MVANILKALAALVLIAGALYLLSLFAPQQADIPPVELSTYREVDDFSLTNQDGETITRSDVEGKVWLANFIFTSCAAECPTLSMRVAAIQRELAEQEDEIAILSFSVDPQTDTPERLAQYAKTYGAKPGWDFLTGEPQALDTLIKESFLLPVATTDEEREKLEKSNFVHSNRFAVVDREGVVRFYQDGMEAQSIERTLEAMRKLLNQPSQS